MNVLITLALKNLKRNKRRTISTIIGIVVSVILISFILTLIYSFQTTMIEDVKSRIGNYHIRIDQTTTHIAMKFNQMQEKIENTAISQIIGAADYETQLNNKQGIIIEGYDEIALYNRDINLIEGRMPQNEKEILISNGTLRDSFDKNQYVYYYESDQEIEVAATAEDEDSKVVILESDGIYTIYVEAPSGDAASYVLIPYEKNSSIIWYIIIAAILTVGGGFAGYFASQKNIFKSKNPKKESKKEKKKTNKKENKNITE